eukprot:8544547-Alexandrium_andersonii.AAC.1
MRGVTLGILCCTSMQCCKAGTASGRTSRLLLPSTPLPCALLSSEGSWPSTRVRAGVYRRLCG